MFAGLAGAGGAEGDPPQVASARFRQGRHRLGARGVAFGAEDGLALGTRGQLREESGDGDPSFTGLGG